MSQGCAELIYKVAVSMFRGDDCDPLVPREMALRCLEGLHDR
jgi:hypothetical protein